MSFKVCAGIHTSDIPAFPYSILWEERVIRFVTNLTRRGGEEFMTLAGEISIKMHVQTFSLGQANEALDRLRKGLIKGAGVLVQ